jgi:hypothetical protein
MKEVVWRPSLQEQAPPTIVTHCPCCGALRGLCVCSGSYTIDSKTGEHRITECEPSDHGREKYGF